MLEIQIDPTNPVDVSVAHVNAVVPLSITPPHIREVKAALVTIREVCKMNTPEYLNAIETIERFVNTR